MALLGGSLILFKFEDVVEAKRVFHSGVKWFNGKSLLLKWWNPHGGKGCSRGVGKGFGPSLASLGKLFKRLGEACESLVAIDEDTAECRNSQWARILPRIKGKLPSSL